MAGPFTVIATYTLTTNASGGAISRSPDKTVYDSGEQVALTAVPDQGYQFTGWQGDASGTTNPLTITMNSNKAINAAFAVVQGTLSVAGSPSQGGVVTGAGSYPVGSTQTINATANSGYRFAGWNDGNTNASRQVTVPGNYTANFVQVGILNVVASPSAGGTVGGAGTYDVGTQRTITATANNGYRFVSWNDGSTASSRNVTVAAGTTTYTATFVGTYVVTTSASPSNGGTVSGAGTYDIGQSATLTASPSVGYRFVQWQDSAAATNPRTISAGGNYNALFEVVQEYTVTVAAAPAEGGTVDRNPSKTKYNGGDQVTITATPAAGYTFTGWSGDANGTINPLVLTVNGNKTITANFSGGPQITRQPGDVSVAPGSEAMFAVEATGAAPLSYRWFFTPAISSTPVQLSDVAGHIAGAQTAQLRISNVQAADVGDYVCEVTGVTSAKVLSTSAALRLVSRIMRVSSATTAPGSAVAVPIVLSAQGNENACGFSLSFDPAKLTYQSSVVGSAAADATLNINNSQAPNGKLGIALGKPAGQTFASGDRELVVLTFMLNAAVANGATVAITFSDTPVTRETASATAETLSAGYQNGLITALSGYEADMNGNGVVTVTDWVKIGRIVAGLDPMPTGVDFMKADCAGRSTLGNGAVSITDWVQAGRYAAGLDPLTPVGGPAGPQP